ncbi:EF hand family protein [Trichomonas vaginalis G3]|uniref:EF hand family protein n=1 Tax=Trichomonas vaginalis (strain ATCC PRA-98 / G3) TaxID=412133 RepID=A2ETB6_TRIV3|nr:calcium-binding protein family [Trichomonas vaginalis G3]EAY04106.1 EF hand family protein [Trichomonas vaginalis G3]KAI5503857.1 calcium-binding protein family [Trichomonas vaginalis G3]|eukprot:XP_001316329.1 EF hand family protein [Trichomonas vaginalis G3]
MQAIDVLTPKKIEELQSVFKELDTDNTGKLEIQLVEKGLRTAGANPTQDEVKDILEDISGSNTISFNTFAYIYFHVTRGHSVQEDLIDSFRALDSNGMGKIKYDVFIKTVDTLHRPLSENEISNLSNKLHVDNGYIDYTEAVKLLTGAWDE